MREEGRAEVLACDRTIAPQVMASLPDQTGELVQGQCRLRAVGRVEIRGRRRHAVAPSATLPTSSPGSICPHGKGCWRFFTLARSARGRAAGSRWSGCASVLTRVVGLAGTVAGGRAETVDPGPVGGGGASSPDLHRQRSLVGAKRGRDDGECVWERPFWTAGARL